MQPRVRTGTLSSAVVVIQLVDIACVLGLLICVLISLAPLSFHEAILLIFKVEPKWYDVLWDYLVLLAFRIIQSVVAMSGLRTRGLVYFLTALQCIYFLAKGIYGAVVGGGDSIESAKFLLIIQGLVFVVVECAVIERIFKHTSRRLVYHSQRPLLQYPEQKQDDVAVDVAGFNQRVSSAETESNQDSADEYKDLEEAFFDARSDVTNTSFRSANSNLTTNSSHSSKRYYFFFKRR
eukprot:TRINITY_DN3184_c0_g1_i2.p2 TRINITY_DN3184_c0_g1~~TRINITY_DN3184_c0_g1_i2.p2  ORF type:complete len:263 (+),score=13.06 TRINITY_DN3184_c0_g1_i2:84-791(+)